MMYLGEQREALKVYGKEAICWLSIKIKGRWSNKNISGHKCADDFCKYCNSKMGKRKSINHDFRDLFSLSIIEELIVAKPKRLIEITSQLEVLYILLGYSGEDFNFEAKKIFILSGYKGWFLNKDKYDFEEKWNYKLAKLLGKHTCTYCNREYIFVYKKEEGRGMVPQMDHWFAKTDNPLLGLSFYNLVPSCGTCNSIKSDEKLNLDEHLHPYLDEKISDTYKFNYWFKETHSPEIILEENTVISSKGKKTFDALNLPLIYKGHSDKELKDWWKEILPILEHNQKVFLKIGKNKSKRIKYMEKLND